MNKLIRVYFALFVLLMSSTSAWALTGGTAYAVLSDNNDGNGTKTLTFKFENRAVSGDNVWEVTNTGTDNPEWYDQRENITRVVFDASFENAHPKSCYNWFASCKNLTSITGIEYLNTSVVADMSGMFYWCTKLTSLDMSHFNTSNVTSMEGMFSGCDNLQSLDVSHFNTSAVTTMKQMFRDCDNLKSLDLSNFNTSNVTTVYQMFYGCWNLKSLDLSNFNTNSLTDLHGMFTGCSNLQRVDLSSFNTANVTDLGWMFSGCSSLQTLDISNFNTGSVTTMQEMFRDCTNLTYLDLSSFNTNNVQTMYRTFYGCRNLAFLNIGKDFTIHETSENGNTAGKTYTVNIFENCSALANGTLIVTGNTAPSIDASQTNLFSVFTNGTLIADDLTQANLGVDGAGNWHGGTFSSFGPGTAYASFSDGTLTFKYGVFTPDDETSWDVNTGQPWSSEVGNITKVVFDPSFAAARPKSCFYWFSRCENLKTIDGIENMNTSNVTTMAGMFYGCGSLTSLDVSHFNTSQVTNMFQMFYNCKGLTSLDVSHFNTGNVTSMQYMFQDCRNLKDLDLSNFNTSKVENMEHMFADCRALTGLNVSAFNTSNVTNMSMMFYGCWDLLSLDVSHFNTSKVTDMAQMFNGCSKLASLDVSNFDTGKVTRMEDMFKSCSRLLRIEVGSFNTSQVIRMEDMFRGCDNLTYLDLSSFNTSQVTSMKQMFEGCINLERLSIGEDFNVGSTTDTENMFKNCTALADGQLIVMVNNASNSNAPTIEQDIFNNVFKDGTLITNIDLGATQSGDHYIWKEGKFQHVGGVDVDYLDKDGKKQTATNALPITAACSSLPAGWYYVGDDVFMNHTLKFIGDAHLILCDGKEMTIKCNGEKGISNGESYREFYIHGQGGKPATSNTSSDIPEGKLSIFTTGLGTYGIKVGDLTITSGIIHVASGSHAIFTAGDINIFGGSVTAKGSGDGFGLYTSSGSVNISGGQHYIAGGSTDRGICSNFYNITLGWTKASDYIYATSYAADRGTLSIAAGQSFACGEQTFSGNVTDAQIANKTLIPASSFAGGTSVTKYATLISNNGDWKITDPDTKVYVPTGNIVNEDDAYKMELREVTGSGIPSGVPVILYKATNLPTNVSVVGAQGDEINVIENNYQAANPTSAFFVSDGAKTLNELIQGALGAVDPNEYIAFTLVNDQLVAASNSGNAVAAGKCIFVLKMFDVIQMMRGTYNPPVTSAPALAIPFGLGDEPTDIKNVKAEQVDSWWTLDGRKLDTKPTTKGLYIHNGRKTIII